ncbi:hypothetical protein [Endozoicomonas sp. G2_2]|uniref:hypothetical protein n=1 Tax=Endozoicomonas sp. G2_2 TaxID=2821092 RepID=UPI001ADC0E56|nr:hypothetical protein [Endozoicomonas sp. G2_2]
MSRTFLTSVLVAFCSVASAQVAPLPADQPDSVPALPGMANVTGTSSAITERQSNFNLQRQALNQEADLVEIQARIAEANARVAEAKKRSEPKGEKKSIDDIDPAKLRVLLGLPAQGPIVASESEPESAPAPMPMPMSPADFAVPTLTSISGNVAIFRVMNNTISASPGDTINKRYKLASIDNQGATLKQSDGDTRRVMIEWAERPSVETLRGQGGRRPAGGR